MARHGISYDDVISAANTLKGQGKSVTIENVRGFLGTGSAGTINQHLRRWKEAQYSTQKIASKENLPEPLIALIKGLWEGVLIQSTEQFAPIESAYSQEISELKSELEKYRANNQRWQKLFNQWQQEKNQLANEKLTLEQALEFAHKENSSLHTKQDALLQQLQDREIRIDELHRLHKQAQENLEHYRESARGQRLLDQQQFEQQKQQLQFEIKNANEQSMVQRDKISTLQQQNQTLIHSHSVIEKNNAQMQSLLEQTKSKLEEVEKTTSEHLSASLHWQNQYHELQKKLDLKTSQFVDIQAESKIILQKQIEMQQSLKDLQDQNKLLSHEKWEIAQEKSHLEGRLRQIQEMIVT